MKKAIDIHGHFGDPACFPQKGLEKKLMQIALEELKREYELQNIIAVCLSPMEGIFPATEAQLLRANESMERLSEMHGWIYQWVVIDPLFPASFRQAEEMIKNRKCVGVKIHPDAHGYDLTEHADDLFAFCSQYGTVLETHSGEAFSMPERMVAFADKYPDMNLIAAHLGQGSDGCLEHQIQAVSKAKNGNIYTDTSSAKSILPHLLEWGVSQVSSEKILFGTDTPLHHAAMMKQRVEFADLPDEQIEQILYHNANTLFNGIFERGFYERF